MPVHRVINDLPDVLNHPVLYSCQYDQRLYRRNVSQRHLTSHSPTTESEELNSNSAPCFSREFSSCQYVGVSPDFNKHFTLGDGINCQQSVRYRRIRQPKHKTSSQLQGRALRHNPRFSYLTSENYRRKRFPTIAQRKAANVREQKRMYNLKEAFKSLRECLPTFSYEKKISRIETLRLSIAYIGFLRKLLDECDQNTPPSQITQNQSDTGREC